MQLKMATSSGKTTWELFLSKIKIQIKKNRLMINSLTHSQYSLDFKQFWDLFITFVKAVSSGDCCLQVLYRRAVVNIFRRFPKISADDPLFTTKNLATDASLKLF